MKSEQRSKIFYNTITAEGLKARTNVERDQMIVGSVLKMLEQGQQILDIGCGYGRISIPLSLKGFDVKGIDLSENLLNEAKKQAKLTGSKAEFVLGNMCKLPYKDASFDVALCLWSTFNELLTVKEQNLAISEMKRVLKPRGWALIECFLYDDPNTVEHPQEFFLGRNRRIEKNIIKGIDNYHYDHDEVSFKRLMLVNKITDFKIYKAEWGGRMRQFLRFTKRQIQ